jgi:myo-inositol-1(or 4)-monophosphatase
MRELLKAAEHAARLGGDVLQAWATKFTAREKSPANLVTEADLASQEAIAEFLSLQFPDHELVGEENLQRNTGSSRVRWFIDPLDGTGNYVHRFPYYAVSIGVEYDGELVVGAIFDPNRGEMFSAVQGAGATLNGGLIRASETSKLAEALCMASLPPRADRDHVAVRRFLNALGKGQSVQRSGSAALNLCSVACGRVDAFWSNSLSSWDMAAGVVIVREAGGQVTNTSGHTFEILKPDLLATNGTTLHGETIRLLGDVV